MRKFFICIAALLCLSLSLTCLGLCSGCPGCISNPHRPVVPEEYGTAEWFARFNTPEEIDNQICCLEYHAYRLRWRAKMDWLKGYRLLYKDIIEYHFCMAKAKQGRAAAEYLDDLIEVLREKKERLLEGRGPDSHYRER